MAASPGGVALGVPPLGGSGTPTTFLDHPNSCRNRGSGTPARHALLRSQLSGPDIRPRCSTANPSIAAHIHVAPDYDVRNSTSPSNADPNASRARQHGRKLFARESVLGVPSVRSAAVKPAQLIDQMFDVCRLNERVVVIRQHAPCEDLARVRG